MGVLNIGASPFRVDIRAPDFLTTPISWLVKRLRRMLSMGFCRTSIVASPRVAARFVARSTSDAGLQGILQCSAEVIIRSGFCLVSV